MIIGELVFVHIPRCSGTSIEHSILDGNLVPDNEKHLNARMIKEKLGSAWDKCFKFSIVRNPFDRMASLYITAEYPFSRYNAHANRSMEDFLINYSPMPWEHGYTCSDYINEDLDMVIKYEDRENGISQVNDIISDRFGVKIDPSVKKRNHPSKNKDFMSYFDSKSRDIMRNIFREDLNRWYR